MPAYDYRCDTCGLELELVHSMSETVDHAPHEDPTTHAACAGPLERLISSVAYAKSVGNKPPSDSQLKNAGFTKYVRGERGYEKAFGPEASPGFVQRE